MYEFDPCIYITRGAATTAVAAGGRRGRGRETPKLSLSAGCRRGLCSTFTFSRGASPADRQLLERLGCARTPTTPLCHLFGTVGTNLPALIISLPAPNCRPIVSVWFFLATDCFTQGRDSERARAGRVASTRVASSDRARRGEDLCVSTERVFRPLCHSRNRWRTVIRPSPCCKLLFPSCEHECTSKDFLRHARVRLFCVLTWITESNKVPF